MPPLPSSTGANRGEPPVRERGDACPGALRLHRADDGRLARLRLPGGFLTGRQAEVLGQVAERLGDGHLDLTSRGNVQLRGLAEACAGPLAGTLHDAGLLPSERHERIRNVVASPLAGLDVLPSGPDVAWWVGELDRLLCGSEAAAGLSGRFLFALDDGRGDVAALAADVTLLAERAHVPGRRPAAVLLLGADTSGLRVGADDAPRAALVAAETFLTAAATSGAWRVRELPAGHGLAAAVATALRAAGIAAESVHDAAVPPGAAPALGLIPSPDRGPDQGPDQGPAQGPDQRRATVSVLAPLGRLTVAQWRLLTAPRAGAPKGGLRVTPWRGVIVPGLEPAAAEDLLARADHAGLITTRDSPWYGIGACTGRPGCAKSLADVRADAAAAPDGGRAPRTGRTRGSDLPVHWSGCERRCGHPQGPYLDRVATGEGTYTTTYTTTHTTGTTTVKS